MTNDDEEFIEPEWLNRVSSLQETMQYDPQAADQPVDIELRPVQHLFAQLQALHSNSGTSATAIRESGLPERIGRYEIQRLLGAGGCAVVYLAIDPYLNRNVALKIPLPPGLLNPDTRKRFVQEAQLVSQLDHPHIVTAYEAGEEGPVPFIAYAFCSGPTLATWLKAHGPVSPEQAARLVVPLASAVQFSHERKILHRDIKPGNVLLFPTDDSSFPGFPFVPRLSDFGLAKIIEAAACETGSSVIMGTPLYMAPEQVTSGPQSSGITVDVYGLGTLLYETLTGQPPFQGETIYAILETIRTGTPRNVRAVRPEVPRDLAVICEKALAPIPEDRYPSAAALQEDLTRFLNGQSILARPVGAATLAMRTIESPSRVQEAAGFMVLSNLAICVWLLFWLIAAQLKLAVVQHLTLSMLVPYSIPILATHLFAAFLGLQLARRKRWAGMMAFTFSCILTLFLFSALAHWITPPWPEIYADDLTRDNVFILLLILTALQAVLCFCAWRSLVKKR